KPVILHPRLERSVHSIVLLHGGGFDPHQLLRDRHSPDARLFRVRARAFERFDQWEIAVPETKGGSKPAVGASCTLKATMFRPKLRPGSGHEDWFLPESLNPGCRSSKETFSKASRAAIRNADTSR